MMLRLSMQQLACFTVPQRASDKVTRVYQLSSSSTCHSVLSFRASDSFKQRTTNSSMLHFLSLIFLLFGQVHKQLDSTYLPSNKCNKRT